MKLNSVPVSPRAVFAVFFAAVVSLCGLLHAEDTAELTVKVDQPGIQISPRFYGLMTEEINHSYDGGLYAELIQNRIFKDGVRYSPPHDPENPPHWSLVKSGSAEASMILDTASPVNGTALTTSLRLDVKGGDGIAGIANDGFWGIPVKPNTEYRASFYARASEGWSGPLSVAIESNDGNTKSAVAEVTGLTSAWKKYTATLKTGADAKPSTTNRFVISTPGGNKGSVWFTLVSLFPPTYHNRPNGLRPDLMEWMAGLKPTFLRFPGGNYLEGPDYENRFNWKETIGPLEERPGHNCPWGYRSCDGLGLLEFLEWCEDLNMEPVLAVYAGLHIDNGKKIVTGDELKPHIQDALDEIEYVTGDQTTTWGARRAKDGHPAPFKLTYVEIGNEDWLNNGKPSYDGRFAMFYDAIKAKYPTLQLIATTDVKSRKPDVMDDHIYTSPANMQRESTRYDKRSRDSFKVFFGEWAAQEGRPTPSLNSAVGDAAFLAGLERNSDLVVMECYAPLLVNVNRGAAQWGTNLIGYDALSSFASPSYYIQKMFAENRGDRLLASELNVPPRPMPEMPTPQGAVGVGTWATKTEYKDMQVTIGDKVVYSVNPATAEKDWRMGSGEWSWDGGTLKQNGMGTDFRAVVGDPGWKDYTYTLKARKITGNEGFLIMFHVKDDDNFVWWNLGGWGNTRSAIQFHTGGASREAGRTNNLKIDEDRWYDIKIEVAGKEAKCYLDGKLITTVTDELPKPGDPVYAHATREDSSGDVLLKITNTEGTPRPIKINLQGVKSVAAKASITTLTGKPSDVNSVANPTLITPQQITIDNASASFTYLFAPHSVNVVRLKAQ